jgi:hypothetical protein
VDIDSVADVLDIHAASMFRVEMNRRLGEDGSSMYLRNVNDTTCTHTMQGSKSRIIINKQSLPNIQHFCKMQTINLGKSLKKFAAILTLVFRSISTCSS